MSRIIVIGARGAIGRAVVQALAPRHDLIEVSLTQGDCPTDVRRPQDVERLFAHVGPVDGVITAAGNVHFGPIEHTGIEQFWSGLQDKLMGQINVVLLGQRWLRDGGSFTLTGGITAHEPVRGGSNSSTVNMALEGFVRGAAVDLPRRLRINLISPTVLDVSAAQYAPYFPGFDTVDSATVGRAYVRSVEGPDSGRVYRVGYA